MAAQSRSASTRRPPPVQTIDLGVPTARTPRRERRSVRHALVAMTRASRLAARQDASAGAMHVHAAVAGPSPDCSASHEAWRQRGERRIAAVDTAKRTRRVSFPSLRIVIAPAADAPPARRVRRRAAKEVHEPARRRPAPARPPAELGRWPRAMPSASSRLPGRRRASASGRGSRRRPRRGPDRTPAGETERRGPMTRSFGQQPYGDDGEEEQAGSSGRVERRRRPTPRARRPSRAGRWSAARRRGRAPRKATTPTRPGPTRQGSAHVPPASAR